ncbi:hypothetical protein [Candidatus Bandiella numerosa]|nr:hypothetical protein [Candidatus Bandiella numerosa]
MTKINDIKSKYEYASLNRKIIAFGIDVVIITLVGTVKLMEIWPQHNPDP